MTWVNTWKGGRTFYTSLGVPAILWTLILNGWSMPSLTAKWKVPTTK